jgi:enoyl-CoA hydratase/carnithine racemase
LTDQIIQGREAGVLVLTLNRPAKKNALTSEMYRALADAMEAAEGDPEIRVVLFKGAGDCFTAGNDLSDFAAVAAGAAVVGPSQVGRFLKALAHAEKPYVAAVHGLAVGVGMTMLLHCDLVYVADDAKLTVPFVNLALAPEAASSWLLPARIGHARAYEMFALGAPVTGQTAVAWGLANGAGSAEQVHASALAAAKALAGKPAGALKITKTLMRDREAISALMDLEGEHFGKRLRTAEAAEAFAAFRERRAADFSQIA